MSRKLLLVDDEQSIRKVLGISLQDRGYALLTAEDGQQAWEIFCREQPEIVLADIKMPGKDGIQLLQEIKEQSLNTEVIMITGHGDMHLAIQSLKNQACDFVTKPIDDDALDIALGRAEEKISMRELLRKYTQDLENKVQEQSARLVEAERVAAAGQILDRLTCALDNIASDFQDGELLFFTEMPCFISLHDRSLHVVRCNQLYRHYLAKEPGAKSWEIYAKKATGDIDCPVQRSFYTGQAQRSQENILDRDGEILPVQVHTLPISGQGQEVDMVLEMCLDVSRLRSLQEKLLNTRQWYQQLFEAVPCYISVLDMELKIQASNSRFKQDFGEDSTGKYCFQVYKHRCSSCPQCPVLKTFMDGQQHHCETVVTSVHGEQYNVLIWTAPLKDTLGEVAQVMEMSINITQIRQLQDHLASLGLLFSSVSHSLKNLFTSLDGAMYKVSSGLSKGNSEVAQQGLQNMNSVLDRIKKMVLDLLNYAKQSEPELRAMDIGDFLHDLVQTIRSRALEARVTFVYEQDLHRTRFYADSEQLYTAVLSILENALDACIENQGTQNKKPFLRFAVFERGSYLTFEIQDNGVGLDKKTKSQLFQKPFSTKGKKGTGLGLFLAKQIVQMHQGEIEVESYLGRGSSFFLRFPLRPQPDISSISCG
ncbi:MAG: response regulator [Desulfohalobiaceae bacterium]